MEQWAVADQYLVGVGRAVFHGVLSDVDLADRDAVDGTASQRKRRSHEHEQAWVAHLLLHVVFEASRGYGSLIPSQRVDAVLALQSLQLDQPFVFEPEAL